MNKLETNKRDVMALLDHIAGCVDNHPLLWTGTDWGNVGDMANIREKLMEIALIFAVSRDNSEDNARRRIEEALDEADEHLTEALIEAS